MSLHLLPEGPVLATSDATGGSESLRLIAWKPETISLLFPGVTPRARPGFPHQFLHLTTRREFGRAVKRSIYRLSYANAEDLAGDDALYRLIADECLKFVAAINWSSTEPSPDAPAVEEPGADH